MEIASNRSQDNNSRYARGWEKLKEIDGEVGERVVAALEPIAPDFGRMMIEFGFGDIYSRTQLDLRAREIATIAALAALGNAQPQLKIHIEAALNALFAAREVFASRGAA